jgi:hypothetical protein
MATGRYVWSTYDTSKSTNGVPRVSFGLSNALPSAGFCEMIVYSISCCGPSSP